MTRYTADESMYMNMMLDLALSSSSMMISRVESCRVDDDITLSLCNEFFNAAYEQRADVYNWKLQMYRDKFDDLVKDFVSQYMTLNFLDNLQVGNRYSTGYMVIMTVEDINFEESTGEVISIVVSDNTVEDTYTISTEMMKENFVEQLSEDLFKCFPILLPYLADVKSTDDEYLATQYEMCRCEKCNELALSSNELFLIMEDDTSELFVCMNCVRNRAIELENTTCQVCDNTNQQLKLCVSSNESTGKQEYQRVCSICIEMFNLDVVDY